MMSQKSDKERLDFLHKMENFGESPLFSLWKELSHFRFAYSLFCSNYLELKRLLQKHDAQDPRFLAQADLVHRSRLQKKIARALFNFLSAGYSLRENIKKARKQISGGRKDPYFKDPILIFGHELRNFFIHRANPSAISGSKSIFKSQEFERVTLTFFYIKKEAFSSYLNEKEKGKNRNAQANAILAKSYLAKHPKEIVISDFCPVYYDAVREYYSTFFFSFLQSKEKEIEGLRNEMEELCRISKKLGGKHHWLPFPISAPRYIGFLMLKLQSG